LAVYDKVMVPRLFAPWADMLLDLLAVRVGDALLDVATGPGTVARIAAERIGASGRVVGADFSPAMLGIARAKPAPPDAAPIEYLECPADALAMPSDSVDVVTCQQGLQFFPDRTAALTEMRRVTREGGRIGIAVWAGIAESPAFAALAEGIREVLGEDAAATYRGGPWGLPDADMVARLVEDAGFCEVSVTRHELPHAFDGGAAQLVETLAVTAIGPNVAALDDGGRARLVGAVEQAAAGLIDQGTVWSSAGAHIARAKA
jgi:SAM-dependent methyltransferase